MLRMLYICGMAKMFTPKNQPAHHWFWCPGCKMHHSFDARWSYNGNADSPTFTPSLLVQYPWGPDQIECRCHSFVTEGKIKFLGDCTHELKDTTVEIPEFKEGSLGE